MPSQKFKILLPVDNRLGRVSSAEKTLDRDPSTLIKKGSMTPLVHSLVF